jgi:hypothetical protein
MATTPISESQAAESDAGLIDQLRGQEVSARQNGEVAELLRDAEEATPRPLSESLALLREINAERGFASVLDEDFAADMREIVAMRSQWNPPAWG